MSLSLIALGTAAFVATDIDGLLVLLVFFANPLFTPGEIVTGQYLGISVLIAASLVIALSSLVVPAPYLGLLGVLPIGIGLRQLQLSHGPLQFQPMRDRSWRAKPLAIAAVVIAIGGDNIATYGPLFSTLGMGERCLLIVLFWMLTGVWCGAAYMLVRHPRISPPIRSAGERILPVVLIGLGIYIFLRMDVLTLVLR